LGDLGELASNVGSVAIQHWAVSVANLTRVVHDDDLGEEAVGTLGWVVLGVTADHTTANILDGQTLDVETDVVTWNGLGERLVVHLDGLDFSGDLSGGEGDDHAWLQDTSLDTTDGHCSDTTNLVDILEWQAEGLVSGACGWDDAVQSLQEGVASGITFLAGDLPALEPWHVGGLLQHVVAVPAGDGDESDGIWVVADLLDEAADFLGDFLEASLGEGGLSAVHLVDGDDELLDTQGEGQQGMLTGLAILGDTSLELTDTTGNDEHGAVSLHQSKQHRVQHVSDSVCKRKHNNWPHAAATTCATVRYKQRNHITARMARFEQATYGKKHKAVRHPRKVAC
jgi:hypothetical protein